MAHRGHAGNADWHEPDAWVAALPGMIDQLTTAVEQALVARSYDWAALQTQGAPDNMVVSLDPPRIDLEGDAQVEVDVTVTLRGTVPPGPTDQVFPVQLHALGDGAVSIGSRTFWVVVPGVGLD